MKIFNYSAPILCGLSIMGAIALYWLKQPEDASKFLLLSVTIFAGWAVVIFNRGGSE
jgi:hypothetical protein